MEIKMILLPLWAQKWHKNCNYVIRYQDDRRDGKLVPALICRDHNAFLKWLSPEVAHELIFKQSMPVEPWQQLTPAKAVRKKIAQKRSNANRKNHQSI
jgi:hypothetical protein